MTETTTAIKPHYKHTQLGWIPEEWEVKKISSLGKIITGSTPKTDLPEYYGGDYLFVSPSDIQNNKFVFDTNKKLTKLGFSKGRKILKGSTLFVAIGSTIGKTAIAGKDLITNQQINSVVASEKNNDEYIYYQLTYNAKRISLIAGKQAVPIINKTLFSKILVPRPPLPEQQKIATILSTWDRAIAKQQQLIAAKQQFKKGLMQRLLTGKKRFEGFEGEWDEVKLGSVTSINPKFKTLPDKFMYIDLESVKSGQLVKRNIILNKNAPSRAQRLLKFEDIIFQTVRPYQKNNLFYELDDISVASSGYAQIRTKQNARFIYHLLHTEEFVNKVLARCTGTSFPAISPTDLKKIKIKLPTKAEQQKIASILRAADQEIDLLQKQLTQFQEQKRGLMQGLLTGVVRVKI